jgi:hypothetical protein
MKPCFDAHPQAIDLNSKRRQHRGRHILKIRYRSAMTSAENYRALSAAQRDAAAKTDLLNRRIMHERAALAWDAMAEAAEDTVAKSAVNAAAKAAR